MAYVCPGGPFGAPPLPEESQEANNKMWSVMSGDSVSRMFTGITLADGTLATPENSIAGFSLADTQFCKTPIWTGTWGSGITEVPGQPGKLIVKIPQDVMNHLRRGGYRFSMTVKDLLGNNVNTPVNGGMLVEYVVGGPIHNIPYRESTYQHD
jgi:hypothetical protein